MQVEASPAHLQALPAQFREQQVSEQDIVTFTAGQANHGVPGSISIPQPESLVLGNEFDDIPEQAPFQGNSFDEIPDQAPFQGTSFDEIPDQKPSEKLLKKRINRICFRRTIHSLAKKSMRIRLEQPNDTEECPLTLSPMIEDYLDFLDSDSAVILGFKNFKKITLKCGHSFGALNILYYFARNEMRCPCCRAGCTSRMAISSLPKHFRAQFQDKIDTVLSKEREETIRENEIAAQALSVQHGIAMDLGDFFLSLPVEMRVTVHTPGEVVHTIDLTTERAPDNPRSIGVFYLSREQRRQMADTLREMTAVHTVLSISAFVWIPNHGCFVFARTENFSLVENVVSSRNGCFRTLSGEEGTEFDIYQIEEPCNFQLVRFRTPLDILHRIGVRFM